MAGMDQVEAAVGEAERPGAIRKGAPEGLRVRKKRVECRSCKVKLNLKVGANALYEEAMPLYEYRCEACGESEEKPRGDLGPGSP